MKATGYWTRFKSDEEGAALLETTVLAGIMLAAGLAIAMGIGAWIDSKWVALSGLSTDPTITVLLP